MRISDWSSDVCSSDLVLEPRLELREQRLNRARGFGAGPARFDPRDAVEQPFARRHDVADRRVETRADRPVGSDGLPEARSLVALADAGLARDHRAAVEPAGDRKSVG